MKVPDRAYKAAVDNAVVVKRLVILKGKVSILHWGNINGASRARLHSLKAPVPKNTSSFERIVSKKRVCGTTESSWHSVVVEPSRFSSPVQL